MHAIKIEGFNACDQLLRCRESSNLLSEVGTIELDDVRVELVDVLDEVKIYGKSSASNQLVDVVQDFTAIVLHVSLLNGVLLAHWLDPMQH